MFTVQSYIDMAQKDKERYVREYMAYQETDSYKEFMRKKYPGLAKKRKVEPKAETPPQQTTKEKASWYTNRVGIMWMETFCNPFYACIAEKFRMVYGVKVYRYM